MIDPYTLDQFSKSVRSAFDAVQGIGVHLSSHVEIEGEIDFEPNLDAIHAAEVACASVSRALEYLSPIMRWSPRECWEQPLSPIYRDTIRFESSNLTRCTAEFSKVCQGTASVGCVVGTSFHDAAMKWTCRCIECLWVVGISYRLSDVIRGIATKEEELLKSSFERLPSFLFNHIPERHQFVVQAFRFLEGLYLNNGYPVFSHTDLSTIESHLEKEYYSLELHHVEKMTPPYAVPAFPMTSPVLSVPRKVTLDTHAGPPPCPVVLQGIDDEVVVAGQRLPALQPRYYAAVKALVAAYPERLTLPELADKSGKVASDARKYLAEVRKLDPLWEAVIEMPKWRNHGYGLVPIALLRS